MAGLPLLLATVLLPLIHVDAYGVQQAAPELLFVGDFYPKQVQAVTGDTMLGLFRAGDGWELAYVRLTVDSIHNACTDRPGERGGRRVRISRQESPVFLVSRVPQLRPGPVQGVFHGADRLWPGQSRSFEFVRRVNYGGVTASGTVPYLPANARGNGVIREYALSISRTPWDRNQTVFEFHAQHAGGLHDPPSILWVGDLDGDGYMDLFLSTSTTEAPGSHVLYLSAAAVGRELMHAVVQRPAAQC